MKRSIVLGVSILCLACRPAVADGINFEGSFLDLLVELDTSHGVTIGLDPFELENPKVTEVRKYRSGSKSAVEFAEAEAKRIGLLMKKSSKGAYYATSAMASQRDRRLALFLDRKYSNLIKIQGESDSLVRLARIIEKARMHSRKRVADLNKVAAKAKSAYPGLEREIGLINAARSKGRPVSDQRFRKFYGDAEALARMIDGQVAQINADYKRYLEADQGGEVFADLVREYGSLALATRAYLEYMVYRIQPVSSGIKAMDPYNGCVTVAEGSRVSLSKPGSFNSRFKADIRRELNERDGKIKELGRTIDSALKERSTQLEAGIAHWKANEFHQAFEKVSLAIAGGDFSSRTRALYGLFWTKAQSTFAKEVQARGKVADKRSVLLQAMAGVDEEFVEQVKAAYPGLVRGSVPKLQNPGRRGASYGLTVSREAGQVSTFGIQARPLAAGGGSQQIEVNSVGQGFLDEHMVASIQDSLNYVAGQHVPTLFDERIVVLFDSTVDIAYGGDSAGAALAVAALSQSKAITPPADVCMTGAVRAFGDVRPVGGIFEKTQAARTKGFRVLLAPLENESSFQTLSRAEQLGPCQIILGKTMNDFLPFGLPELEGVDLSPRKALASYAIAYHLFLGGRLDESLAMCEKTLELCPKHLSARSLATILRIAGAKRATVPASINKYLAG